MDFDKIKELSDRIKKLKEQTATEEATKTAFILPFIRLLGYDVFNPTEVVPEFTADIGSKKGEKVDYAIFKDGVPVIIIECKHWREALDTHNAQIQRYFNVTKSKVAIITNGIQYSFFTDIDAANVMDKNPFLHLDMEEPRESVVLEIAKFHKNTFDPAKVSENAETLKYFNSISKLMLSELSEVSNDFAEYFARKIYSGKVVNKKIIEQFTPLVKRSLNQIINDKVNERLRNAISNEEKTQQETSPPAEEEKSKVVTTQEELDAFRIIVAILCKDVDRNRIIHRDTQSYFSVFLDHTRKLICRLKLTDTGKTLIFVDKDKNETKLPLNSIEDLYNYANELTGSLKTVLEA